MRRGSAIDNRNDDLNDVDVVEVAEDIEADVVDVAEDNEVAGSDDDDRDEYYNADDNREDYTIGFAKCAGNKGCTIDANCPEGQFCYTGTLFYIQHK